MGQRSVSHFFLQASFQGKEQGMKQGRKKGRKARTGAMERERKPGWEQNRKQEGMEERNHDYPTSSEMNLFALQLLT